MTPVAINNKQYVSIALDKEATSLIAGAPSLPSISRSIIIPNEATMTIRVLGTSYEEYQNILVAPSKGNLLRTVNPADVPYEFGDIYTQNTWYPSVIAELQEPYSLGISVVKSSPFTPSNITLSKRPCGSTTISLLRFLPQNRLQQIASPNIS